ncbi:MAG: protein phosphatase 2C domain-containing protein [Myxococcales bacterium]|nr:protein phosphatase 2C domain-containing protein [Myxococcales bacterium]
MLHEDFELADGTVAGRDHVRAGRNNQDARACASDERAIVAIVCDGCGSCPQSELGAQLTARVMIAACREAVARDPRLEAPTETLAAIQGRALDSLRALTGALHGEDARGARAFVHDALLCTVIGLLVTPGATMIFAAGDGAVAVNDRVRPLGPFPGNSPPYLASALLTGREEDAPLRVIERVETRALSSAMIASDGALELEARQLRAVPGTTRPLGPLRQFWTDDRYFRNPDALRRQLALANREVARAAASGGGLRREHGLLPDDTTIVALRRRARDTEEDAA